MNGGYFYAGITTKCLAIAGCNSDAVTFFFGILENAASGSEKVQAACLNDRASERYSRVRYYMQLYGLWRAAMGRMPAGHMVKTRYDS